jgi:hypothetical protein
MWLSAYLHGHLAIVHQHLSCQEISPDCGFVAGAELLVDLCVDRRSENVRLCTSDDASGRDVGSVHIGSSNSSCPHRCRPR